MMVAWLFPGQGSQAVGMGRDLVATSPAAREVFERADAALGEPLSKLILEGPEDELVLTANAQPAIVTTSLAALAAIREAYPDLPSPRFAAGHSLGEYSALVAAGALSFEDAVRVVRARGRAMQDAVPVGSGAMAAIMGMDKERLEAICREVREELDEVVECANYNAPGQIVIAGTQRAVTQASERARSDVRGESTTRTASRPLNVSAPFHCAMMAPAAAIVAETLGPVELAPLSFPIVSNVDARPNDRAGRIKELLVRQVTGAVRWEQAVRLMHMEGISHAIEIGPGKVLAGLCRRIAKDLKVLSVGDSAGVRSIAEFLALEAAS